MKKNEQLSLLVVKKQIDNLVVDSSIKVGLKVIFLSLGISCLWLAWWWKKLPPEVPLFFSRAYGESRLANQWGLWLLPVSGLISSLISIRVAGNVLDKDRLLAQILIWLAALMTGMGLISLIQITRLVI